MYLFWKESVNYINIDLDIYFSYKFEGTM